jgi:hypothetical protein
MLKSLARCFVKGCGSFMIMLNPPAVQESISGTPIGRDKHFVLSIKRAV